MRLRQAPEAVARLLDQPHAVRTVADAWLGGEQLAADIPLVTGELSEDGDQEVPERVSLTVPAVDLATGTRWHPGDGPDAPLAANGQRLRLTYRIERGDGREVLSVPLGWYQVVGWDANDHAVDVEAVGLLNVIKEYRLLAPTSPPAGATFVSEVRRLMEGRLPVYFDPALVDRAVPATLAWDDDRLAALYELADAWPAELYVDEQGVACFVPEQTEATPAAVELVEYAGTIVSNVDSGTRDGVANIIVARGESTDPSRPPVTAVARDDDPASPTRAGGPYGDVVEHYASPLLTTTSQALSAGRKVLRRKLRVARSTPLETLPDPRLRPGVRADFVREDGSVMVGAIAATRLALVADGGPAAVAIEELPQWT